MLFYSAFSSALAFFPIARAVGGQIPVIDGVIGGVPNTTLVSPHFASASTTIPGTTTPGKLRVVENSGVCGK